jgi:enoyl-[acyl-carrier-protein] reductase (NADH)
VTCSLRIIPSKNWSLARPPACRTPSRVGIANESSIAAGCVRAFVAQGATLAATYLNDKALPHVRPVTDSLGCELLLPCDVSKPGQLEAVFDQIRSTWGRLDFLLHAIAFAPADDLHGRVVDCSAAGSAWRWTCRADHSFAWPVWWNH